MSAEQELQRLADVTADAVLEVLSSLCGDASRRGAVSVLVGDGSPFESLAYPMLATGVEYTEGVSGGNVFTLSSLGARRLAAAMLSQEPPTQDDGRALDELEMSALSEAMNQMMAASAAALGTALGYPVNISVPSATELRSSAQATGHYQQAPYATRVSFDVVGEPASFIQLVPHTFIARVDGALSGASAGASAPGDDPDQRLASLLGGVPVTVAAELGRTRMSFDELASPTPGAVVRLDRAASDPVDLCVNGHRFARGELLTLDEGELALRVTAVTPPIPTVAVQTPRR